VWVHFHSSLRNLPSLTLFFKLSTLDNDVKAYPEVASALEYMQSVDILDRLLGIVEAEDKMMNTGLSSK
jgi:hypothetical protein